MTKNRFWKIIAASRKGVDSEDYETARHQQAIRFRELLSALSTEDLLAFAKWFGECLDEAYSEPREGLWAVAFDIASGCSDDMFDDFRGWLISMGREVFEEAIRDPETVYCIAEQTGLGEDVFFEEFEFVLSRTLREKT